MKKHLLYFILLIVQIGVFSQCSENERKNKSLIIRKLSKIIEPQYNAVYTLSDTLNFQITALQDSVAIDSFNVKNGNVEVFNSNGKIRKAVTTKTGIINLRYTVYLSNGKKEQHSQRLTFLSDVKPESYTFQKINTLIHDPDAYTQGLFYENGFLYESTGQNDESTLRKIKPQTGEVLKKINIPSQYFGEGVTTLGDKIFMLTWKSRKGFVFNKNTFEQISTFNYSTEGWGITTIGDSLVMSDGTENLYFLEPQTLTEIGRIQVYDQYRPINRLNELEYINGHIYANIYETEEIAIIDPLSGKLLGKINCEGLFNKSNYNRRLDVFNGIAYNNETGTFFVTGKWWPKLYEIQIIKSLNQ